jgi:putative hydrolase of the HAD superfamily
MDFSKETVKVLLFDLGNVIINVDFAEAIKVWSAYAKVNPENLKSRFIFDASYERHERNELTGSEYFASLRRLLNVNLTDAQLEEGWNAIYKGEVPGIQTWLKQAKKSFQLYAFSNTNPLHWAYATEHYAEALRLFDKVFTSSELKKRKPSRESFEAVVTEIGVPAHEILFFDDLLENVTGARAAGVQAVQVTSVEDTKRALEYLGVMR